MVPHATMKYKKKLRLLVTNKCSRKCLYCHNEGMSKQPVQHLEPAMLECFLPDIKKYTNKAVLSGGEPFEYKNLKELVDLLISYGFDLSLITANIDPDNLAGIGYALKNLHYSIHDMDHLDADVHVIRWLNNTYPTIRISLNVPFAHMDTVKKSWDILYSLALEVGANIQFIRIFSLGSDSHTLWNDRWKELITYLESRAQFLEATERESRYITKDFIKIDLLDIPCRASGMDFSDGACLNNSDITIDPALHLSICRWTNSSVPLYQNGKPVPFDKAVGMATKKSCQNCRYGEIRDYFRSDDLDYYRNAPHYTWPRLDGGLKAMYTQTFASDISYYGKSGSVLHLENEFSKYIGVNYSLSVVSGTTAVYLACLALGLSHEDEVLIPVATFPTLVAALLSAGVRIKLCDIDPITGLLSLESLRAHITPSVKAVLVTHLWGLPVDMEAVRKICSPSNIYIIEDCSHAYGAEFQNRRVGSFGDVSCFSLQANKAVYAGEGGMLVTSSRTFYERAVALSSSADRILDCVKDTAYLKYWGTGLGLKLKMNPLGAPLALASLANIEAVNQQRQARISLLEKSLHDSGAFVIPGDHPERYRRVYYTYKLTLKEPYIAYRDELLHALIHQGLEATVTSFIPVYQHELCSHRDIVNAHEHFPDAEKYYRRVISLPAFVYEPIALVEHYADIISKISGSILHRGHI